MAEIIEELSGDVKEIKNKFKKMERKMSRIDDTVHKFEILYEQQLKLLTDMSKN